MQPIAKEISGASIKIAIIQVMALLSFGLGYSLINTAESEKILGVLVLFVGFHTIVNACDLGLTTSMARGDDFTWCDISTIAIYGFILSLLAGNIFAHLCKYAYQIHINPNVAAALFYTIFLNGILKGFLDRKKKFIASTLINVLLIALSTNFHVVGFDYDDANGVFIGLAAISVTLLAVSIYTFKVLYQFESINKGSYKCTSRKIKRTIMISVINVQGNLYGRVDRFIYPYIWGAPVPNEFMLLSEAAQRLLVFTSSISRAAIPYLGKGEIKFKKLNLIIEIKILAIAALLTIISLIIVSIFMTNNRYLDSVNTILFLSISIGLIVLSQYYFTGYLVSSEYMQIIRSQIYSLVVFLSSISLFASTAEMLSLAMLLKTLSEYFLLKSRSYFIR